MYNFSLVTFIDILGFRGIVAEQPPEQIGSMLELFERTCGVEDVPVGAYDPKVLVFSDSVIRTMQVDSQANLKYPIGLLFHELLSLLHIQAELVTRGILVRGGLTLGEVAVADGRVFGPAFNEAYTLESKVAEYPRIVVSPAALRGLDETDLLIAAHHNRSMEKGYVHDLLRQGDDGMWFVDYLYMVEGELDDPADYVIFLQHHRDLITKEAQEAGVLSSRALKYNWLACYHNGRIAQLPEEWFEYYDVEDNSLLVHACHLPALYMFD